MRKILIGFVLMLVFLPVPAYAQDYYVDATNGDNSNNGTSPSSAWKTISKVNSMSFNPGDNIYFERGQTWRESLAVPSSGNSTDQITFTNYGSGNKPIILGSEDNDVADNWTDIGGNKWATDNGSFTTDPVHVLYDTNSTPQRCVEETAEENLSANWEWFYDSVNDRVIIYHDVGNPASQTDGLEIPARSRCVLATSRNYITIDGVDLKYAITTNVKFFSEVGTVMKNFTSSYAGSSAVYLEFSEGFDIDNVTVAYTMMHGMVFSQCTGGTIQNCDVSYYDYIDATTHALSIYKSSNLTIENNYLHHDTTAGGGSGIGGDRFHDCIIQNNEIDNYSRCGIDLSGHTDEECYNNIVRYNLIHDGDLTIGEAIQINSNSGEPNVTYNNEVYYNIIYNDYRGIVLVGDVRGNEVYNNVIYNMTLEGLQLYNRDDGDDGPSDNLIKNNIVHTCAGKLISVSNGLFDEGNVADNNCFYDSDFTNKFLYEGTYSTLAAFQSASGQDANSIDSDPLFVNASNADFHLQSNSLCIDNGTDVGLTLDFEGNPVPQGNASDIGAYEYQSHVTGNVYYVDATNGDDSNDGLSEGTAWKTIQKAADSMVAGDTCIVLPGFYDERVQIFRSGTYGAPITFQAAGSSVVTKGFEVQKYGGHVEYIIIDGFEIANTEGQWGEGQGVALIDTKYCEVKNNYIHHTVREGILIHGWGDHGSMDSSHNKIINNTIVYAGTYAGITLGGDYNLLEGNDISNTIQCPMGYDSTATGKDADGVKFSGKGHIIRGNYIHDLVQFYSGPEGDNNGSCRSDCEPAHHDCWQSTKAVSDAIFEDNICDLADDRQFYYSRTFCRTCEPGETACISWNPYQGILMSSSSGAVTNVTFRNNIWKGKGAVLKVHATIDWPADDIIIAHNNFIGPRSGYAIEVTRSNNAVIKNNLIYEVLSSGGLYIGGVTGTSIEIGNNLIYVSNGTVSSDYPNDRYEEPELTDIPNGNYRPLPGSPVIDSGVDAGIIYDYDGNPRPIDGDNNGSAEFDIGAYEYAGGTPGDIDNDGDVDIIDLGIIATNFGKTSGYDLEADVVLNNEIDVFDLVFVASRFT